MPAQINALIPRMWPEPMSEVEREHLRDMDELEFSVFAHKLELICVEGKEVLAKTGASMPLQSEDSNTGLYTATGDMAASAPGVYYHSLTGQLPVKWTLDQWAGNESVRIEEGDIFYSTDPLYGATHTPDQIAFMPVFAHGELVAWVSSVAHQSDVGAVGPGMPPFAQNRFQDGLRLSPIKIGERDRLRDDLIHAFAEMTRAPDELRLDIKARVASCVRMRNRLKDVAETMGAQRFRGGLRRCIEDVAEQAARKLERYKDGVYRHVIFLDSTGVDVSLLRLQCELRKHGERITIDISGCSPQVPYAYNAYAHMGIGAFANPLFSYLFSDLPASVGILRTVDVVPTPEGTIVSADENAAVTAGLWPTFFLQDCFHVCLMKMAFASADQPRIAAPQTAIACGGFCVGVNQYGRAFADLLVDPLNGSGSGARPGEDGVDVFCGIWGNWMDTNDAEQTETRGPYLKLFSQLNPPRAGFGRYRGGIASDAAYLAHQPPGMLMLQQMGMGCKIPAAPGLFGGYAGSIYPGIFIKGSTLKAQIDSGEVEPPTSSAEVVRGTVEGRYGGELQMSYPAYFVETVQDGDLWCYVGAHSGGYGDALERDPQAVLVDLGAGLITEREAREIYHVRLDELTGEIDEPATAQARDDERRGRLSRSRPYAEFVAEWSQKRPPEEALRYYGTWPHPTV
ncbi:MAG TPA: hydantoinase B/oxoprolinase family protein [Solirubrobacteraceae bacterium]|jgi:acetophenone carboxylase|nr:hydantoinase B/oxoprolinase family protein [Solirubrobacteraceae bacterium]